MQGRTGRRPAGICGLTTAFHRENARDRRRRAWQRPACCKDRTGGAPEAGRTTGGCDAKPRDCRSLELHRRFRGHRRLSRLAGLFTAHVTGNFVTLGATVVLGPHGAIAKLLALPEFVLVVALVGIAADRLARRQWPAVPLLLSAKVALLVAFFALAVALGPFADSDAPAALDHGLCRRGGDVAERGPAHPSRQPCAGHADDATRGARAIAPIRGAKSDQAAAVRGRFNRMFAAVVCLLPVARSRRTLYAWVGFWCLAVRALFGAASAVLAARHSGCCKTLRRGFRDFRFTARYILRHQYMHR